MKTLMTTKTLVYIKAEQSDFMKEVSRWYQDYSNAFNILDEMYNEIYLWCNEFYDTAKNGTYNEIVSGLFEVYKKLTGPKGLLNDVRGNMFSMLYEFPELDQESRKLAHTALNVIEQSAKDLDEFTQKGRFSSKQRGEMASLVSTIQVNLKDFYKYFDRWMASLDSEIKSRD